MTTKPQQVGFGTTRVPRFSPNTAAWMRTIGGGGIGAAVTPYTSDLYGLAVPEGQLSPFAKLTDYLVNIALLGSLGKTGLRNPGAALKALSWKAPLVITPLGSHYGGSLLRDAQVTANNVANTTGQLLAKHEGSDETHIAGSLRSVQDIATNLSDMSHRLNAMGQEADAAAAAKRLADPVTRLTNSFENLGTSFLESSNRLAAGVENSSAVAQNALTGLSSEISGSISKANQFIPYLLGALGGGVGGSLLAGATSGAPVTARQVARNNRKRALLTLLGATTGMGVAGLMGNPQILGNMKSKFTSKPIGG